MELIEFSLIIGLIVQTPKDSIDAHADAGPEFGPARPRYSTQSGGFIGAAEAELCPAHWRR